MTEKETKKSELKVSKIKKGTVLDHISAGMALIVLEMLGITGREGSMVTISLNVPSKKKGKKDIVKIEDRFLDRDEINQIALISPKATINEIKNFEVVNKFQVKLPQEISGFPKCINPRCITNAREPPKQSYKVKQESPLKIRCKYCNISMEKQDIIKQLIRYQGLTK
ncbi:MAG: aspartate carbamoyltransferase regulatory subunit [Asgard group archaeon]|nr:aspartate carbamoyltransferase regulatory subunit [Asgard group archaeon]